MKKSSKKTSEKPDLRELLVEMIANQRLTLDAVADIQLRLTLMESKILISEVENSGNTFFATMETSGEDDLYEEARQAVIDAGKASTSYLQRKLRIGYSRSARLMDILEERGVISAQDGTKPREILIDPEEG